MVFFIRWRVVAEESGAAHFGFGGAMLLDLLGPRSDRWSHDGEVAGGAVANSTLVIFRFGATMELGRSRRSIMRPGGAGELRGIAKQAALKDQRYRPAATRSGRLGDDGARPRGAGELRGHRQQAALKDQRFRGRVPPLYPLTRAHEVDIATRWGRHQAAVADSIFAQFGSGPRRSLRRSAERPARAAWATMELGRAAPAS